MWDYCKGLHTIVSLSLCLTVTLSACVYVSFGSMCNCKVSRPDTILPPLPLLTSPPDSLSLSFDPPLPTIHSAVLARTSACRGLAAAGTRRRWGEVAAPGAGSPPAAAPAAVAAVVAGATSTAWRTLKASAVGGAECVRVCVCAGVRWSCNPHVSGFVSMRCVRPQHGRRRMRLIPFG